MKEWWDNLSILGPTFGYYPNGSKTHLVVKEEYEEIAKQLFDDTDVHISIQGTRHLGAAIGSKTFTEEYVSNKVQSWVREISNLAKVAATEPHSAYAAFTHGLSSHWSYISRTIPDISDLLQPLEDAIHQLLIPAITGRIACSIREHELLALPVRLGGMGLINPARNSPNTFSASERLTAPLAALIVAQDPEQRTDIHMTQNIKKTIRKENRQKQEEAAREVYEQLSPQMQCSVDLSKEKGSSSWLMVLPLDDHDLCLHKGEFRDALSLRYGWSLSNIPQTCNCGKPFSVNHAMVCHMGGFPTIRHNEIRDITASLLTEVCHKVATEPCLQSLSGETFDLRSANVADNARLDIRARGFWNAAQDAFFDVRVFHPNAPSNRSTNLQAAYKKHESSKKREYGQRVRDIEHGVFTPLVLSTTGGAGREATTFYKRLADLIPRSSRSLTLL